MIGDPAPLTPLVDPAGRTVTLGGLRGETTLLVFLRHLG